MQRLVLALVLMANMAGAQTAPPAAPPTSAILTLDQDKLFADSLFGKALMARTAAEAAAAEVETRQIDSDLEIEERDLTEKRATMEPAQFKKLAEAFDTKVKRLRAEREAAIAALREKDAAARQEFIQAANDVIGKYMVERGAVAIIDQKAIIVRLNSLDITAEVVALIDKKLGDGTKP